MTALTITAADVAVIREWEWFQGPAQEAITAGQYVRLNPTYGTIELGNCTSSGEARHGGVATVSAAVGQVVHAICRGEIDLGEALVDLAYDATVYVGEADGALDSAVVSGERIVGRVFPFWDDASAPGKVLRVEVSHG